MAQSSSSAAEEPPKDQSEYVWTHIGHHCGRDANHCTRYTKMHILNRTRIINKISEGSVGNMVFKSKKREYSQDLDTSELPRSRNGYLKTTCYFCGVGILVDDKSSVNHSVIALQETRNNA